MKDDTSPILEKSEALQGSTEAQKLDEPRELDKIGTETLLALLQSKTRAEAASKLSIDESTLYMRINKYGLRERIAEFPKDALMRLQLSSVRAAEVLTESLEERVHKLEAATEILNRVGLSGVKETLGASFKDGDKEVKIIVTRGG